MKNHELRWEPVQRMPFGEDQYLDVIWFQGGVFADSLPDVPLYAFRKKNPMPLVAYSFQIINPEWVPVSEAENTILSASSFHQTGLQLHAGHQSSRSEEFSTVNFYPFRYLRDSDSYEKLVSFSLQATPYFWGKTDKQSGHFYPENSLLSEGNWFKVCVAETGIYRLNAAELQELGVNTQNLLRSHIRMFGHRGGMLPERAGAPRESDPREIPIYVSGGESGNFAASDYILFYAESPNTWNFDQATAQFSHQVHLYSEEQCYFLNTGQAEGLRVEDIAQDERSPTHVLSGFQDYAYHQRDLSSLIGSGRVWYGEVFETTLSRDFTFDFTDLDVSVPVRVKTEVAARSPITSSFRVMVNNQQSSISIGAVNLSDQNNFYARSGVDSSFFQLPSGGQLRVQLTYNRPQNTTARGWLNYIAVNVHRHLRFSANQLGFRHGASVGAGSVARFNMTNASSQIEIWEVTDPFSVKRQNTNLTAGTLSFVRDASVLREYRAFIHSGLPAPRLAGKVANQNLHGLSAADMIVVTAPEFHDQAERLAQYRRDNDGLSVHVVGLKEVYNEFSSGHADISAVRNLMKMFYDRATHPEEIPLYLLLFGNGTIDNKDMLGFGGNLIPTYQSQASLSPSNSYMTDDYFGLLADSEGQDAAGLLDLGIGRLPVRSHEEAVAVIDKIIRYDQRIPGLHPLAQDPQFTGMISNYADWRNVVVFIADDEDSNTHFNHAESLSGLVKQNHPDYNIEKIYLDAFQQVTAAGGSRYPDVNRAINERVNKGAVMINYIGHGGVRGLAHERVVTFDDIATWNNYYNMPVFMTATCEFSSFDQPDPLELSAGVRIFLKPDGGASALYTTTRLAWSGTNLTLNYNFMNNAFRPDEMGRMPRLGDLIRIAKVESDGNVQPWRLKNFVLLGDPSMQMAYPRYQVITQEMPDTLRALQHVTIQGYIANEAGVPLSHYNGVLYPTVYDKKVNYRTLGNDPRSFPADFQMRNAMLYRGQVSIENGFFSFDFMVPKDIAYPYGQGKISYYADDGMSDAMGAFSQFVIGGTMPDYTSDNQGPEIRLFMNDTTFVSGGLTDENPLLLALISDESGINISGRIGHDILAVLNENSSQPIVLNRYFQTDLDSFTSGRVLYPFSRLEEGPHSLMLRAWDIHNNPSSASIDFVVRQRSRLLISDLMNYPNPFSDKTSFVFTHNSPFTEMDVSVRIYDLSGRLLKTIRQTIVPAGFRSAPVEWDGRTNGGQLVGNGIYVYQLQLNMPDGRKEVLGERLVILRD